MAVLRLRSRKDHARTHTSAYASTTTQNSIGSRTTPLNSEGGSQILALWHHHLLDQSGIGRSVSRSSSLVTSSRGCMGKMYSSYWLRGDYYFKVLLVARPLLVIQIIRQQDNKNQDPRFPGTKDEWWTATVPPSRASWEWHPNPTPKINNQHKPIGTETAFVPPSYSILWMAPHPKPLPGPKTNTDQSELNCLCTCSKWT